jgi:CRP/FNR family transcriptional regulator
VGVLDKISLRSVPGRVAKTLLEQAEQRGGIRKGLTFTLDRTQSELAHELATSRESVARALGDMRRMGIISTRGREVTVLSVEELECLAQGETPSAEKTRT